MTVVEFHVTTGSVSCGLGFLSCVSAELYKNAQIMGIDTFEHVSLKRSSLEGAKENARTLGFSDRIDFKKGDVFRFSPLEKFDIIVSNLVFHNFGKKRFKAYSLLSSWTQAGSFVVIGDLFFSPKTDIAHLEKALSPEADQTQEWFPRLRTARDVKGFAWIELTGIAQLTGIVELIFLSSNRYYQDHHELFRGAEGRLHCVRLQVVYYG